MKRLFLILFLLPGMLLGAYTEFYCQSGGSNSNSGSDTSATAKYTVTNGGWSTSTNVFTPADGSNPVSAGVVVGDFASLYVDGAATTAYVARVTAVTNAANGTITVSSTAKGGSAPSTSGTARTIKVGGAWLGPNAAVTFPMAAFSGGLGTATDAAGDPVRINMKNTASYSISAVVSATGVGACTIQGYASSVGDGGKAIITSSSTTGTWSSSTATFYADLIFESTAASGTSAVFAISAGSANSSFTRCVFHGGRGSGWSGGNSHSQLVECEAYDNNKSNTAGNGGFVITGGALGTTATRCISHDNTGSNTAGFVGGQTGLTLINCIADTNGGPGFSASTTSSSMGFQNCDFYNNGSDGIKYTPASTMSYITIQNCNFVKNAGKGINIAPTSTGIVNGFADNNGYGSGTQANGSANALANVVEANSVTYAADVTPWNAPISGDFNVTLATAQNAGRGAFTTTQAGYGSTVGYPDIGAAQHTGGAAVGGAGGAYTFGQ